MEVLNSKWRSSLRVATASTQPNPLYNPNPNPSCAYSHIPHWHWPGELTSPCAPRSSSISYPVVDAPNQPQPAPCAPRELQKLARCRVRLSSSPSPSPTPHVTSLTSNLAFGSAARRGQLALAQAGPLVAICIAAPLSLLLVWQNIHSLLLQG